MAPETDAVPVEPLRISFEVNCAADHAFDTWARRIDTWWAADHTASGEPDATIVLETEVGGREGRCRVDIRPTAWERLGTEGRQWRDRDFCGWNTLLPHFVALASATHPSGG